MVCTIICRAIRMYSIVYQTVRAFTSGSQQSIALVCDFMFQILAVLQVRPIHSNSLNRLICSINVIAYSLIANPALCHSLPDSWWKYLKRWSYLMRPAILIYDSLPKAIKFCGGSSPLGSTNARVRIAEIYAHGAWKAVIFKWFCSAVVASLLSYLRVSAWRSFALYDSLVSASGTSKKWNFSIWALSFGTEFDA